MMEMEWSGVEGSGSGVQRRWDGMGWDGMGWDGMAEVSLLIDMLRRLSEVDGVTKHGNASSSGTYEV